MKAVIMAGGEGRRLRAVTGETPKPLVPLLGRPLMEHILLLLKAHGITEVCAALKYRSDMIRDRFGDGSALGVQLRYCVIKTTSKAETIHASKLGKYLLKSSFLKASTRPSRLSSP